MRTKRSCGVPGATITAVWLGMAALAWGTGPAGSVPSDAPSLPGKLLSQPWKGRAMTEMAADLAASSALKWFTRGSYLHPAPAPATSSLLVAPSLARLRCYARLVGSPPGDVSRALAAASGGIWTRSGLTWLLTDRPELARLTLLGPVELSDEKSDTYRRLTGLGPNERLLLEQFGVLNPLDLSVARRKGLTDLMRISYATGGGGDAPETLALNGVSVHLEEVPSRLQGPSTWMFSIKTALRSGAVERHFRGGYLRRHPASGASTEKSSTPSRLELPEVAPAQPTRTAELVSLASPDPRLGIRVRGTGGSVADAAGELARVLPFDLLLCTRRDTASVRAASPQPTAADLCTAIADATGGRWVLINKVLTLQPDPGVERVTELLPEFRQYWLQSALERVTADLDPNQRKQLLKEGHLEISDLDSQQQGNLKWAVRVVFVQHPDTPVSALALQGVRLKLAVDGKEKWVSYEVPRTTGAPFAVRAVPLR